MIHSLILVKAGGDVIGATVLAVYSRSRKSVGARGVLRVLWGAHVVQVIAVVDGVGASYHVHLGRRYPPFEVRRGGCGYFRQSFELIID